MKRRTLLKGIAASVPTMILSGGITGCLAGRKGQQESIAMGPYAPSWDSLKKYEVPSWYKNAKFGIWAHWGPQCEPEHGDWYAREMYVEGNDKYNYHLKKYGHPSKFGFKDVINEWKAENWNPDELIGLYKKAGAQYFMSLANHHDNFDLYDSKYHNWNSKKLGPKKDIVGGWADAAKKHGLHFGVSVHAAHAWTWYETSRHADKKGPCAGIPYDGGLTKADGKGKWWEGFDPQELYAQNHPLSVNSTNSGAIHGQWAWGNGASQPDQAYTEKFLNRTIDLINRYEPEVLYFDDTVLPLWPISDVGLKIAAHFYNSNIKRNNGNLTAVLNGKILDEEQRKCMVWDIERGQSNIIEPFVWQTDTCIGSWHYDRRIYEKQGYKSAQTVVQILADVVSKNGNLLLSVPVRGDGTIDAEERKVVEGVAAWMSIHAECIYDTTPWVVFGEGPALADAKPLTAQGFNEGKGKPFGPQDIRFTKKGDILYAIFMGWPEDNKLVIKSLAMNKYGQQSSFHSAKLLGSETAIKLKLTSEGLEVNLPPMPATDCPVFVLKLNA